MIIKNPTDEDIEEFLRESNAIESEYSDLALQDSKLAWMMSVLNFKDDFSINLICSIHERLMKRLNPKIAGNIRNIPIYIGNYKEFKECLKPESIDDELKKLIDTWNKRTLTEKMETKEKENFVKKWHVAFERIHPFVDGNGRTGRIVMNLQRLSLGLPILIIHEGEEQFSYYKWFKD